MKRAFLAVISTLALTTSAEAAQSLWQGDAYLVSSSGTCDSYNPAGGHYRVRYSPANVGTNSPDSAFAWFSADYTQSYFLAGASFDTTSRKVLWKSIYDGSPTKSSDPVSVSFDTLSVAVVKPTTKFLNIEGTITNYDLMAGCTVKFRMALGLSNN